MCCGYVITITVETIILVFALSPRHPLKNRFYAGIWLTACTYPIVWLVIPAFIDPQSQRTLYLAVAETFAPAAECALFWLVFGKAEPRTRANLIRDMVAIVIANLASFGFGLLMQKWGMWEWLIRVMRGG
ncbi:MAG: hypothetical protein K8T89_21750 [Planctomycetes bacterium]|nr:hypothetical protein [Planctomycetota bacterium]